MVSLQSVEVRTGFFLYIGAHEELGYSDVKTTWQYCIRRMPWIFVTKCIRPGCYAACRLILDLSVESTDLDAAGEVGSSRLL